MFKTVIVTDNRIRILARCTDHIKCNDFFNAVCFKVNHWQFIPSIVASENTVTRSNQESVRISWVEYHCTAPVNSIATNPRSAAVLQIICLQRTAPSRFITRCDAFPSCTAVGRTVELRTPCNSIIFPCICVPHLRITEVAAGCNQLIGILRVAVNSTISVVGCRADVGCFASLWIVLIQCTAAAECDAAAVGDQEVAVCVCIDSGRIIIGRKVFAQRLEVIRTNISNNQTVFALNGRTNINLAILNMNDGNTVLVVIFCIGQSSCHVFCPGRPLDGIFEKS